MCSNSWRCRNLQVFKIQAMEEKHDSSETAKVAEAPEVVAPVRNDAGCSSSQPPPAMMSDDGVPEGGWKREEPESLRRLSEAMEGWKNKQQQIHRKFMEEFDNLGRDLSKMQHDTVNFKSEIDIVKDGLQRRASSDKTRHTRTSILAAASSSVKEVPKPNNVQK